MENEEQDLYVKFAAWLPAKGSSNEIRVNWDLLDKDNLIFEGFEGDIEDDFGYAEERNGRRIL